MNLVLHFLLLVCKHCRGLSYSKANLDLDSAKSGPHIHALAIAL